VRKPSATGGGLGEDHTAFGPTGALMQGVKGMSQGLPNYADLPVQEGAPPGSSWGVWGDHDVLGCLNLLTPERVLAARTSIRTGRSFGLSPELTIPDPPLFGRQPLRYGVEGVDNVAQDDVLTYFNTQSSGQWDGFRHFPHPQHGFYGGIPDESHGVNFWAERGIVGRAVLLDLSRWRASVGRPLEQGKGDPIVTADLNACINAQECELLAGDILLVRTGWLSWYRQLDEPARVAYAAGEASRSPGLGGRDVPAWLWDHHVAAVVGDNPAVEVIPPPAGMGFLRPHALPLLGIPLGEMWDLDALADDCAADGTYDCFLVAAPLNLPGGIASPPNAVAIR
jgi:Putative cyclase